MVQYVITPWRNRRELLQVRAKLYPEAGRSVSDEEKRYAAAKVAVWVQRGNCPHLVESTAILTEAILNDVGGNSTYCVRAAYAAAFCRFVTGLLDGHQDKRRKLSMYSIAKTIGLPATYVELRHQATHEELPSLSKLRTASRKALRWIWDYYWDSLSDEVSKIECKTLIWELVKEQDEQKRKEMTLALDKWDEDLIGGALADLSVESDDPDMILRTLGLANELILKSAKSTYNGRPPASDSTLNNIEDVRAEIAMMERELEAPSEVMSNNQDTIELSGKGWDLWEGPWVPKPIGIV